MMDLQLCEHTANPELSTLNGGILWYVNHILIKPLLIFYKSKVEVIKIMNEAKHLF